MANQAVFKQNHLDQEEKAKLLALIVKFKELFRGQRGQWKGKPVNIQVLEDAKPVRAHPYSLPLSFREEFKTGVYRQCDIGIVRELSAEEAKNYLDAMNHTKVPVLYNGYD